MPFPVFPDSFIAIKGDDKGTAVEFYPSGQVLLPGEGGPQVERRHAAAPSEAHLAIGVDRSEAEVHAIGQREGWRTETHDRGPFHVIELWVDNLYMLEILTPAFQAEYLGFATIENFEKLFLSPASAA
ncbi:hypothetical protein [Emcibacter sp. SYSU 3D8]|uniref:hypothetical protein n=1 Tax=Emcibacter sp. SYSU 3D8 TaxID=3133969 RepID=UPI0031FEFA1B